MLMFKLLKHILLLLLLIICTSTAVLAEGAVTKKKSFTVTIPEVISVEGVGPINKSINYGVPVNRPTTFDLLVRESMKDGYWELTTIDPIGISVSYNVPGTIMAVFVSMNRASDGYPIPDSDLRIYPSKVLFDKNPVNEGDAQRIFHFNPIIRVSKQTPPGSYIGTITFTVVGQ